MGGTGQWVEASVLLGAWLGTRRAEGALGRPRSGTDCVTEVMRKPRVTHENMVVLPVTLGLFLVGVGTRGCTNP